MTNSRIAYTQPHERTEELVIVKSGDNYTVRILSEKQKQWSKIAVGEEIPKISEEMEEILLPAVEKLKYGCNNTKIHIEVQRLNYKDNMKFCLVELSDRKTHLMSPNSRRSTIARFCIFTEEDSSWEDTKGKVVVVLPNGVTGIAEFQTKFSREFFFHEYFDLKINTDSALVAALLERLDPYNSEANNTRININNF